MLTEVPHAGKPFPVLGFGLSEVADMLRQALKLGTGMSDDRRTLIDRKLFNATV